MTVEAHMQWLLGSHLFPPKRSILISVFLGRAVFVSCLPSGSCNGREQLSVEDGGSVEFDVRVVFVQAGSCGFRQTINRVTLVKINPRHGVSDEIILSCAISESQGTTCTTPSRASLDRGNDPGFEFVFTLNDVSLERDAGSYRVTVDVLHVRGNSAEKITKEFFLEGTITTSHWLKQEFVCTYNYVHASALIQKIQRESGWIQLR